MAAWTPTSLPPSPGMMSSPMGCQRVWMQFGMASKKGRSSSGVTKGTNWYTRPLSSSSSGQAG